MGTRSASSFVTGFGLLCLSLFLRSGFWFSRLSAFHRGFLFGRCTREKMEGKITLFCFVLLLLLCLLGSFKKPLSPLGCVENNYDIDTDPRTASHSISADRADLCRSALKLKHGARFWTGRPMAIFGASQSRWKHGLLQKDPGSLGSVQLHLDRCLPLFPQEHIPVSLTPGLPSLLPANPAFVWTVMSFHWAFYPCPHHWLPLAG